MSLHSAGVKRTIVLGILAVLFGQGRIGAEEKDSVLQKIFDQWENRQRAIRTLKCRVDGEGMIPKGRFTNDEDLPPALKNKTLPEQDYHFEKAAAWYLDFERNRARKDEKHYQFFVAFGVFAQGRKSWIYDGNRLKFYEPKKDNRPEGVPMGDHQPELVMQTSSAFDLVFNRFDSPIFFGCGTIPLNNTRLDPRKLRFLLDRKNLYYQGKAKKEGVDCVVLRSMPAQNPGAYYDELWVDTAKEGAILRWTVNHRKGVRTLLDVRYKHYDFGWFPESWTTTYYDQRYSQPGPRKIELTSNVTVTELTVNTPLEADVFDVQLTPGMVVLDLDEKVRGKRDYYKVGDDAKTLIPFPRESDNRKSRSLQWVIVCFALGVLAAFGIYRYVIRPRLLARGKTVQ